VTSPDVEILIPPKPEYVGLARHVVGATARLAGLTPASVENAKLAVSEAATNAVTVTAKAASPGPVEVRAELEGDRILVEVSDRGEVAAGGLAAVDSEDPDSLDFSFERGLSLPLIQGLVDELEIAPREGGGTTMRMAIIDPEFEPRT
jgi:anti-sigma regulatory factor (Ser/Thr protein kinase)